MNAPSLELIGFSKRFGALAALDDVSVKVQAGSFHALLGENGAGKSTLVKCAMGYYAADEGQILLDGRAVVAELAQLLLRLLLGVAELGQRLLAGLDLLLQHVQLLMVSGHRLLDLGLAGLLGLRRRGWDVDRILVRG